METVENKYITLAYKLYTIENGEKSSQKKLPQSTRSNSYRDWASHWNLSKTR